MSQSIKILALTKYARLGASSRMRTWQYLPFLKKDGMEVTAQPLITDDMLRRRYQRGFYGSAALACAYAERCKILLRRRKFDILWIEKEALPWLPLWVERALLQGMPYVLDYDDAIFHNYDRHGSSWVRRIYGRRLDGLMAGSTLVIGGNNYLADRARQAGASWVEVVPTAIDLTHYPMPVKTPTFMVESDIVPRIVWIGSPTTVHYLNLIRDALQTVAEQHPFILRIIGGGKLDWPGVAVEAMPWSEATESDNISGCTIGIMPLLDSPWERGKCGYKLIQYMACGLPVVASAVGVNPEIVKTGDNGFLATDNEAWVFALLRLLNDPVLCAGMGASGRRRVEQMYCIQRTGADIARFLRTAVEKHC